MGSVERIEKHPVRRLDTPCLCHWLNKYLGKHVGVCERFLADLSVCFDLLLTFEMIGIGLSFDPIHLMTIDWLIDLFFDWSRDVICYKYYAAQYSDLFCQTKLRSAESGSWVVIGCHLSHLPVFRSAQISVLWCRHFLEDALRP